MKFIKEIFKEIDNVQSADLKRIIKAQMILLFFYLIIIFFSFIGG